MTVGDFLPTASLENLRLRAELLRRVRDFFDCRGFFEVETPLLSAETIVDEHLEPIEVEHHGRRFYLQTSPEAHMKRLLAAGAEAIYQITRAFRGGEAGPLHNPEFTIVEWYRAGDNYAAGRRLLDELIQQTLGAEPAEQISYREAFARFAGVDVLAASQQQLLAVAKQHDLADESWGRESRRAVVDLLFARLVQPRLGESAPTLLYDFPADQAALAQIRHASPPVAERFEIFVRGVELANGYHELLDAAELRQRAAEANQLRAAAKKSQPAPPERLLAAMQQGLPAAAGTALGFDRLAMLAAGADKLADVCSFPIDRA